MHKATDPYIDSAMMVMLCFEKTETENNDKNM